MTEDENVVVQSALAWLAAREAYAEACKYGCMERTKDIAEAEQLTWAAARKLAEAVTALRLRRPDLVLKPELTFPPAPRKGAGSALEAPDAQEPEAAARP